MRKTILSLFLVSVFGGIIAQLSPVSHAHGSFEPESGICLLQEERETIEIELAESRKQLIQQGKLATQSKGGNVLHAFPVGINPSLDWNSIYAISGFVDQDPSSGVTNYFCTNRTYDGHQGTDYYLWPFQHYLMNNDLAWGVASAAGTIILKSDGQFDQQCAWSSGVNWNAIYIEHADGTIAWHGHFKSGSLTTKLVGETVEAGEFLGVLGSSGYSTAPHLHFELHHSSGSLIDPYFGECNALDASSSWIDQPAYFEMTMNAVLTHNAPPSFGCPTANEFPNMSDQFMPGDLVYYAAYYKDHAVGVNTAYKIYRPNGTLFNSWTHASPDNYFSSWWYWTYTLPFNAPEGVWTFSAEFGGNTYSHEFTVGEPAVGISEIAQDQFKIYPNPSEGQLFIENPDMSYDIELMDATGRVIPWPNVFSVNEKTLSIDVSSLAKGIYFMQASSENGRFVKKWVKE